MLPLDIGSRRRGFGTLQFINYTRMFVRLARERMSEWLFQNTSLGSWDENTAGKKKTRTAERASERRDREGSRRSVSSFFYRERKKNEAQATSSAPTPSVSDRRCARA